jgi:ABC-type transporter MlaC component
VKIKSMFIATAISLAVILLPQAITFADDGSSINQKALDFVNLLFQRSAAACRNLSKVTLLNGTETQEGFCKLVKDSVLMDDLIPYVAGKEVWSSGTDKQKQDFALTASSNLSIFIALGFQNYTQGDAPDFCIDYKKTTDKSIVVKVLIPNDKQDMVIKLKPLANGRFKVYDSVINGISTMQNKKADFSSASQGSLETLTAKVKMANKRSGYGECQADKISY